MKVAKLYRFHDIRIEDIPVPELGPHDALIETKACGICSGDVMPWYIEKKAPLVLGHEPAGVIVETGTDVAGFRPGDRVFVHHHAPCLSCSRCLRGNYVQCDTWKKTRLIPGGISEYILVPRINLENDTLKIPDGVTFEDATLIEPAACVMKGLKRMYISGGETLLIIGLGVMGQMHIPLSRKYGVGKIIGADMVPYRLSKAKEIGADEVIDVSRDNLLESVRDMTDGEMADIVVVAPNSVDAMNLGIESAGPGGKVLFFTPAQPGERLSLDINELYFKDMTLITSYSCGPDDTKEALSDIANGVITAQKFVTHQFTIEDTARAFGLTSAAKNSLKCIIVFGKDTEGE